MVLIHKNQSLHDKDQLSKNHGFISQKMIPQDMVGRTYLDFFMKMMLKGNLCIGLYRRDDQGSDVGVYYLSLNPDQKTLLQRGDAVYIFSAGLV